MQAVSVAVDLEALSARIAEYGDAAYLVTVTDDQQPHVVSVRVRVDGEHLAMDVGRGTRANLTRRPTLTLLWHPVSGGDYSLIVDGTVATTTGTTATGTTTAGTTAAGTTAVGATTGGGIAVLPDSAVLHRVAGAAGQGPTCRPVTEG
jgi:hypothetical protein